MGISTEGRGLERGVELVGLGPARLGRRPAALFPMKSLQGLHPLQGRPMPPEKKNRRGVME